MNQQNTGQQPYVEYDDEIDLVDYIQVLIKRKVFILLCTLCFAIGGGIYVWTKQTYEAKTLILLSLKIEEKGGDTREGSPGVQIGLSTLSPETYEVLATTDDLGRILRDSIEVAWRDSANAPRYGLEAKIMRQAGASPQLLTLSVTSPDRNVPVSVVNTWTRLFVERNRGLSSGVAQSYHEWVEHQYQIAQENLTETEVALQAVQARYHNLNILKSETTIKSAELDAALTAYQSLEVGYESRLREQAYLQDLMQSLERDGNWLGFLSVAQIPSHAQAAQEPASMRKDLIFLMHELAALEQDSIAVLQKHEQAHLAFRASAQQARQVFSRDQQIDVVRKQVAGLSGALDAYRTERPELVHALKNVEIELSVYQQNVERESPVLLLGKAIADEALWQQVASGGRVSEKRQEGLGRYRLQSEHFNPVYQYLTSEMSDAQVKRDLYVHRLSFLDREIPALQNEVVVLQAQLDSLEVAEQNLEQELEDREFALVKRREAATGSLLSTLARRRLAFDDHRAFYLERKQRLEILERELQRIREDVTFQRDRFMTWRGEMQGLSSVADSLEMQRVNLDRRVTVYRETYLRFSRLLEEARISLEQAAGDLQVVSWAADAGAQSNLKYFVVIVLAGGMAAVFAAFVLEYVQKARERLGEGKGAVARENVDTLAR